jgi:hypothetical protein
MLFSQTPLFHHSQNIPTGNPNVSGEFLDEFDGRAVRGLFFIYLTSSALNTNV